MVVKHNVSDNKKMDAFQFKIKWPCIMSSRMKTFSETKKLKRLSKKVKLAVE